MLRQRKKLLQNSSKRKNKSQNMNQDDPEIITKIKDLFGNLEEPPKKSSQQILKEKYPGLFPNWKK